MPDKDKREAAANALLDQIAKSAQNVSPTGLEHLAHAYRAVVGGAQPGGGSDSSSK